MTPASTAHSDNVRSDTSFPKYRMAAVWTPQVPLPRLMVLR